MTRIALAAYTPHKWHDIGGRMICWWTRSPYSHVEIVVNGVCYSSSLRDGGVRKKVIDLSKPRWRVIPIEWVDETEALWVFEQHKGTRGMSPGQLMEYVEMRNAK